MPARSRSHSGASSARTWSVGSAAMASAAAITSGENVWSVTGIGFAVLGPRPPQLLAGHVAAGRPDLDGINGLAGWFIAEVVIDAEAPVALAERAAQVEVDVVEPAITVVPAARAPPALDLDLAAAAGAVAGAGVLGRHHPDPGGNTRQAREHPGQRGGGVMDDVGQRLAVGRIDAGRQRDVPGADAGVAVVGIGPRPVCHSRP